MPGRSAPGGCGFAIHHLAVDGVSWRILVPDLAAAWQAIAAGQAVALPPRGTLVPALGATACGACAGRKRCGGAFVLGGQWAQPSLLLVQERLDPARDTMGRPGICG